MNDVSFWLTIFLVAKKEDADIVFCSVHLILEAKDITVVFVCVQPLIFNKERIKGPQTCKGMK